MGVSENRGTVFCVPYNNDPTIEGTIGSPISPLFSETPKWRAKDSEPSQIFDSALRRKAESLILPSGGGRNPRSGGDLVQLIPGLEWSVSATEASLQYVRRFTLQRGDRSKHAFCGS